MKKIVFLAMMLATVGTLFAQKPEEKKSLQLGDKVRVTPYGFVRNYFTYDSRKTYTVIGGEYNMIPYDENWNLTENEADLLGLERTDLNAVPDAKFLAITTRIGLNLDGPIILGAKSSGKIEADFGGFSTTNTVLRLRHAYMKLNWKSEEGLGQELLAGQTWHPLSGDIMPELLGMAAGAPFRAHSRTPQLRYIMTMPNGMGFTASLLYQLQYMYNGPSYSGSSWSSTASTDYANHAIMPEMFLGLNYKSDKVYMQLGADVQPLRPRTFGVVNGVKVPVDELLVTCTPTAYFQYTDGLFALKSRYILANNTSHVNQLNGYAVTGVDSNGTWSYAPLKAHIAYLNLAYGKKVRANLFFGYMKNLGTVDGEELHNFGIAAAPNYYIYTKGGNNFTHLDQVWRVAPSISYNLKAFNVGLEYEVTAASYGEISETGSIVDNDNLHTVINNRLCLLIKYNF